MKRIVRKTVLAAFLMALLYPVSAFSEEFTFVTANVWAGIDYRGFIKCNEYETANDRRFREEVLISGLKELNADIIVLNGVNPAADFTAAAADALGMQADFRISRSGFRIGPVSLPVNLREGDAVLTADGIDSEPAGRINMNGRIAAGAVTMFSRRGVQVIGRRVTTEDVVFYVFSAVWSESLFNDEASLTALLGDYLNGDISAEEYPQMVEDAVNGAEKRLEQAAETLSFINSTAGEAPVVLMGSLNALPGSEEIRLFANAGFVDVFQKSGRGKGYTIDVAGNSNFEKIDNGLSYTGGKYRADYILVRGEGVVPKSAEIVLDKPVYGVYPSNRYGVRAVIELPADPSE